MKINELFEEVQFKNVFNALYKNFYKKDNLPPNKVTELSMDFQKKFKESLENNSQEIEQVMDKDLLAAHVLFGLKK